MSKKVDSVMIRMFWAIFMPFWLIITVTLIIPIIWYIISGRGWIDPEIVYNKLNQNKDDKI